MSTSVDSSNDGHDGILKREGAMRIADCLDFHKMRGNGYPTCSHPLCKLPGVRDLPELQGWHFTKN